ncbi:MAG: mechanosensitive ion channel domain-containing protein [Candidatus Hodarchaeales archaeon]|jgi:hypothetical protein
MANGIEIPEINEAPDILIKFLGLILLILLIWIIGRFLKFAIRRIEQIPPDAKNGIILMLGLIQIFTIAIGGALIYAVDSNVILGSSAFFATAIGFASTTVAANLVGGLYIMITRPFGVGDFIKVRNISGVVLEIGLNYTKLLQIDKTVVTIPNSNLLNATLLNSNISIDDERRGRKQAKQLKMRKVSLTIPDLVLDTFDQSEIVRFSTLLQLKLNQYSPPLPLKDVITRLKKVCKKFTPIFGFEPRFYFGNHVFRQDTHLIITSKDTDTLLENYPNFMDAIMESVFVELQGGK